MLRLDPKRQCNCCRVRSSQVRSCPRGSVSPVPSLSLESRKMLDLMVQGGSGAPLGSEEAVYLLPGSVLSAGLRGSGTVFKS